MKDRWNQLSQRDKKIVIVGGIFLAVLIIYLGMYSPFVNHVDSLHTQIEADQKRLAFMQEADIAIKQIHDANQEKNTPASPVILLALLQKQINDAALNASLTQLKQGAGDTVSMQFKKVEFDSLMRFLISVMKEQKVVITQMTAVANGDLGLVDVAMVVGIG